MRERESDGRGVRVETCLECVWPDGEEEPLIDRFSLSPSRTQDLTRSA